MFNPEYRHLTYQVNMNVTVTLEIAGRTHWGKCENSPVISYSVGVYSYPNYDMVDRNLRVGGIWNPSGKRYSCRKNYLCKQKCCYGDSKYPVKWNAEKYGYLDWNSASGMPYCNVGSESADEICTGSCYRCACR